MKKGGVSGLWVRVQRQGMIGVGSHLAGATEGSRRHPVERLEHGKR